MGEATSPSTSVHSPASMQRGIMLVRPNLHSQTDDNAATFKRWTIMHFNDLLHCSPPTTCSKGITCALRYTSADGQLLYTIHADDVSIWQTSAYYAVSRRLDLESTREVAAGESAVLSSEHAYGDEPMVWHLVDATFGIFEEHISSLPEGGEVKAYHALPEALLSRPNDQPGALQCALITLTYISPSCHVEERNKTSPPKQLIHIRDQALNFLSVSQSSGQTLFSSTYRHRPDTQPDMHPAIAEGADGNGSWVVCILAEGEVTEAVLTDLKADLNHSVQEAMRKECGEKGKMEWGVKVGVWMGEVFMC